MKNGRRDKGDERSFRKSAILEAAMKLFSENDFHEVTVEEIAKCADLAKGTVYLYFKNKEDLFFSVVKGKTVELLHRLKDSIESNLSFHKRLRQFVKTYLSFFDEYKSFFKIIHSEKCRITSDSHYQMHDWGLKIFSRFLEIIRELVETGQREGSIRNVDADSAARGLRGILNSFVFQRVFTRNMMTIEDETDQVLDFFLHGVSK